MHKHVRLMTHASRFLVVVLATFLCVYLCATERAQAVSICANPQFYAGQSLCYPADQFCGECVSFVKVCAKDYRATSAWKKGRKVFDADNIPRGAAIATFDQQGHYHGHAAIFMSKNKEGIQVWDQWSGHPVSERTIKWNGERVSNNGMSFYVID